MDEAFRRGAADSARCACDDSDIAHRSTIPSFVGFPFPPLASIMFNGIVSRNAFIRSPDRASPFK
jgi:hypothetical protein